MAASTPPLFNSRLSNTSTAIKVVPASSWFTGLSLSYIRAALVQRAHVAGQTVIPRVFGGFGGERAFDLPQTIDGVLFYECHHPAWRPDGQQILCTRIQTAEAIDGYSVSRLYGFTYDGSSLWTDPSALVEFMSPEDFNSMFPVPPSSPKVVPPISLFGKVDGLFPPSNGHPTPGTCAGYVWKYAEWCGSERYLIATVFCTDADPDVPPYQALASRVVLIDLDADTATTTAYTDLTGIIEELEGAEPGTYDGVFATCGAIPGPPSPVGLPEHCHAHEDQHHRNAVSRMRPHRARGGVVLGRGQLR